MGLNKRFKLKNASDYSLCFDRSKNKSFFNSQFVMLVVKNNCKTARLGFAIAKKNIKKATDRNLIKRIICESFIHNVETLPNFDIVFLAQKARTKNNKKQMRDDVEQLWQKLRQKYSKPLV
ncbi:MAG: ribonuclease P protein component [Gammaproteobacteria bacterium]|nr:MAG: ribonuclease P protein component [Gammaproteobacteria bacterium]